jgi:hypothetical protein
VMRMPPEDLATVGIAAGACQAGQKSPDGPLAWLRRAGIGAMMLA